ncbi:low choriolytic enzyme-like [Eucyclogobius newberryi]|uniref:low choriolytic enzyme-like n=1 Tax=Eucyclogobius newberryi TaxID=166745 RepID=UPI003B592240
MAPALLLLLMVLLGLCTAHHGHIHGRSAEHSAETPERNDISGTILRMNNGLSGFIEGDMILPKSRSAMKCISSPNSCLWPKSSNGNVEIPYVLSHKYDSTERNEILRALKDFETKTCIRFMPRQRETAYLSFEPRYGCASSLGRLGDKQLVTLQKFGCVDFGIIQHEVMHALGFYHEHNRSDRDQYVRINWENIISYFTYNFDKVDTNNLATPYDYSSIMHYSKDAFGKNWADTITPIPDPNVPIGQRDHMSDLDVKRINLLYKCWG